MRGQIQLQIHLGVTATLATAADPKVVCATHVPVLPSWHWACHAVVGAPRLAKHLWGHGAQAKAQATWQPAWQAGGHGARARHAVASPHPFEALGWLATVTALPVTGLALFASLNHAD